MRLSFHTTHTHTRSLRINLRENGKRKMPFFIIQRERGVGVGGDNTLIGRCSSIYKWAYQLEFSWLEEEGSPTLMALDTGWTLPPSCPSSGVGNTGPPVPRHQTPSWLSQSRMCSGHCSSAPRRWVKKVAGGKQLLKLFCLPSIGQTQAHGHTCLQQDAEKCGFRVCKRSCAQLKPRGPRENQNRYRVDHWQQSLPKADPAFV